MTDMDNKRCGHLVAVDLETRADLYICADKIAAVLSLKDGGPARLLFDGGGHIDVCGSAEIWACELAIERLSRDGQQPK